MDKGHDEDCGLSDVNVNVNVELPPAGVNVNWAEPDDGNVIVGTGMIETWLCVGNPQPPAVAGAEVTFPVDPGDAAAGLTPELEADAWDDGCP